MKLAEALKPAIDRNGRFGGIFEFSYHAATVLAKKSQMGLRLTAAYKAGDRAVLKNFAEMELPDLKDRMKVLRRVHMENWFALYKPFGWDIMDMRYGSLMARIDSAIREVRAYLDGEIDCIEELAAERLYFEKPGPRGLNRYGTYVSPSHIDPRA